MPGVWQRDKGPPWLVWGALFALALGPFATSGQAQDARPESENARPDDPVKAQAVTLAALLAAASQAPGWRLRTPATAPVMPGGRDPAVSPPEPGFPTHFESGNLSVTVSGVIDLAVTNRH